jgi:hypothetical protein
MTIFHRIRQSLTALVLVVLLVLTTGCNGLATRSPQANYTGSSKTVFDYSQLARGDSATGQEFGNWVVGASKGLITDAFVRENNKLGAVISSQVRPNEVKALAQSLTQGFRKNFPNRDLTVLMYAPDKELILTARYDVKSKQIDYKAAS